MKVSIIVPIYNSELYLTECIDSILNQDFTDWELLLIDDGSSDLSGKICDSFASKDRRIRVFHRENSGVSVARNWGLFQAVGDYICFIDSDDMVTPDYLSSFWKDAVNTDLYMQGYQIVDDGKRVQDIVSFGKQGQIITMKHLFICMLRKSIFLILLGQNYLKDKSLLIINFYLIQDFLLVKITFSHCNFCCMCRH